jgi:RNA polymerase sigma-70 factor (ECF subfamily)
VNVDNYLDADLVRRYRLGDEAAAAILYQRYAPRLLAVARTRCGRSFASRFDPEDVAQAAFRDLFARLRRETAETVGDLWGLLLVLTLNKIRTFVEHHSAAKRSVKRTCSADDRDRPLSLLDRRSAGALEAAAIWEEVDGLDDCDRRVIRLRLDGYEVDEIVKETGRSRRTVERVLHAFRMRIVSVS